MNKGQSSWVQINKALQNIDAIIGTETGEEMVLKLQVKLHPDLQLHRL